MIVAASHRYSHEDLAGLISRSFQACPLFGSVEPERYAIEKLLPRLKQKHVLTVSHEGCLAGVALLASPDKKSICGTFREHHQLELLAVDPRFQKNGFGRSLCESAERMAKGFGGQLLAVSATQRSSLLKDFYERQGYIEVETVHWPDALDPSSILVKALTLS